MFHRFLLTTIFVIACSITMNSAVMAEVGVGAKPLDGATLIFDGSRKMLDDNWTYWKGPRFSSS